MDTCVILFKQPSAHHVGNTPRRALVPAAENGSRQPQASTSAGSKARCDRSGDRAELVIPAIAEK